MIFTWQAFMSREIDHTCEPTTQIKHADIPRSIWIPDLFRQKYDLFLPAHYVIWWKGSGWSKCHLTRMNNSEWKQPHTNKRMIFITIFPPQSFKESLKAFSFTGKWHLFNGSTDCVALHNLPTSPLYKHYQLFSFHSIISFYCPIICLSLAQASLAQCY